MFGQQVINASMLGIIYSLIAVGFNLYYGVAGVADFCHGDFAMVGAFACLALVALAGYLGVVLPQGGTLFLFVLIVGVFLTGLIGIFRERHTVRPFRFSSSVGSLSMAPVTATLIATFAFGVIIREFVMVTYPKGANPQAFPEFVAKGGISLGEAVLRYDTLILILVGIALIIGVHLLIHRTRMGLSMRALAQNMDAARIMGVPIHRTVDFTFLLGSVLGAAAGIMSGAYYGIVRFDMGVMMGLKGFSCAIVGGLGNIYGSMVGGLILGFLESFVAAFVPQGSKYKDIVVFLCLILFLIFRPMGILGDKEEEKA
jgi:branched-chain amino acid transport system permease protein